MRRRTLCPLALLIALVLMLFPFALADEMIDGEALEPEVREMEAFELGDTGLDSESEIDLGEATGEAAKAATEPFAGDVPDDGKLEAMGEMWFITPDGGQDYWSYWVHVESSDTDSSIFTWNDTGHNRYAVHPNENITYNRRVRVVGDVLLVLGDRATLTVYGGIEVCQNSSLTIYRQSEGSGKLVVTGAGDNAGIGGSYNPFDAAVRNGGSVTIYGGNIEASGVNGSGIGGASDGSGGNIAIYGGNVTAISNNLGAGIGCGQRGSGGSVTIKGGNVLARGGDGGAGIGGGPSGGGVTVTIDGGTVTANGGGTGAGIGGGGSGNGGSITINGGTVVANGGGDGVGIGGNNPTVCITGGTVAAGAGQDGGAGIGGAAECNGGTIEISGGSVTAAGHNGAGIGGGTRAYDAGGDFTSITISGGQVMADSTNNYAGIGGVDGDASFAPTGTVTLKCSDATRIGMIVNARSYSGTLKLENSFRATDGSAAFPATNAADDATKAAMAGKTLAPAAGTVYPIRISKTGLGSVTASPMCGAEAGETVRLTVTPEKNYMIGLVKVNRDLVTYGIDGFSFTMPAGKADVDVTFLVEVITRRPSGLLIARMTSTGPTSLKLAWNRVKGADGYDIFFKACDGEDDYPLAATVEDRSTNRYRFTGLKKGRAYTAYIRAWVMEDQKKTYVLDPSPVVYCMTNGGNAKYTNPAELTLKTEAMTVRLGKSATVRASVKGLDGDKALLNHTRALRFISDNTAVATVNAKGQVTAKGAGSCAIHVLTVNGIHRTVKVTVDARPAKVAFRGGNKTLKVGKTLSLIERVKLTPAKAQTTLSWTSSKPDVAAVDAYGIVTALKKGNTVITVTTDNGKRAKLRITVR